MASEASQQTGDTSQVPNQLGLLVPTFDPAVDSVEIWSSKVELLLHTWPTGKVSELATRLILGCKGTAYQKLQLHRAECLVNEAKGIRKIVELVGGTWGQVPLEKKFELVEKALYRSSQKSDETGDSYLSRCDVVWTELISKGMTLAEVRAYIVLRGSRLGPEDKKRVIVESGAEDGQGELDIKRVTSAIRMLASGFFQDLTGVRRDKSLKTYDHTAFAVDDNSDADGEHTFWAVAGPDEVLDDHTLETMAAEDDEDAALVMEFEDAIADTIQSNSDIAAFYTSYQEARKRLSDKVKFRGFWSVRKGFDKSGKKGKMKGRGKGGNLASRIANSYCRICMKKGHWKNECPSRGGGAPSSSASTTSVPTSFVLTEEIPMTLASLDETKARPVEQSHVVCFSVGTTDMKGKWGIGHKIDKHSPKWIRFSKKWSRFRRPQSSNEQPSVVTGKPIQDAKPDPTVDEPVCRDETSLPGSAKCLFASHGSVGVIDLGASQTVIGDRQVPELLQALPHHVRSQVKRVACNLCFRFGNHQTLTSRHALSIPLGKGSFRVAVVPGNTPFLLSSSFLKGIKAVIDTDEGVMFSKLLQRPLKIVSSNKNLFLMDINQLWDPSYEEVAQGPVGQDVTCFVSESKTKQAVSEATGETVDQNFKIPTFGESSNRPEVRQQVPEPQPFCEDRPKVDSIVFRPPEDHNVGDPTSRNVSCPEHGGEQSEPPGSCEAHDPGGTCSEEDRVWTSQTQPRISSGIRGSEMDRLVHLPLYEASPKYEHQLFIEYVKKRVDQELENQSTTTPSPQPKAKMMATKSKAKPVPTASEASWTQVKAEMTLESDVESNLDQLLVEPSNNTAIAILEDRMVHMHQENQVLVSRMTHMENAMQEILNHVRNLSVKAEP